MVKWVVSSIIILILAGAGFVLYMGTGSHVDEDLSVANRGLIRKVARGSGQFEGIEPPPLSFQFAGYLTDVYVREGQQVDPNEVLAELSPEELKVQLAEVQAKLNEAKAKLEIVKTPRSPASIQQAENKLDEMTDELKLAEMKLKELQNPSPPPPATAAQLAEAARDIEKATENLKLAQLNEKTVFEGPNEDQKTLAKRELEAKENELENVKKLAAGAVSGFNKDNKQAQAQAQVDKAQAELEIARTRYEQVNRGPRPEEREKAAAQIKLAQIELQRAQAAEAQLKTPPAPPPPAKSVLEQAQITLAQAKDRQAQAKAALDDLRRGPTPAEISAAEAVRDQAQSALKQLELKREGLKLRAPSFGGLILKRHVEPGVMVSPKDPIITLVDFNQKRVRAEFDVAKLPEIKKDMQVTLSSRAFKADLDGKIERIVGVGTRKLWSDDPAAPKGGEIVEVLIKLDENSSELQKQSCEVILPGLRVDAVVTLDHRDNVVRVPKTYVTHEGEQAFVLKVEGNSETPHKQEVKCGLYDEANIEILAGIAAGDKVVKPKAMNAH